MASFRLRIHVFLHGHIQTVAFYSLHLHILCFLEFLDASLVNWARGSVLRPMSMVVCPRCVIQQDVKPSNITSLNPFPPAVVEFSFTLLQW